MAKVSTTRAGPRPLHAARQNGSATRRSQVPKSVVNNWMREIRKWCPTLRPVKLLGDKHERARVLREELRDPNSFDVCVTSYEPRRPKTRLFVDRGAAAAATRIVL